MGRYYNLNIKRVSNFPARITDVGVLFDLCIHDIDISIIYQILKLIQYMLWGKQNSST